jgi:two-component system, LytTR family, sensor kinase
MKIRWREHEMIFVTILIVTQIIFSLLKIDNLTYKQSETDFAAAFKENGFSFIYWKNVLIPQLSSILLIYFFYLSVNLFIIPAIKKISFDDFEKLLTLKIIRPVSGILVTGYLLAIGVNIISYYAKPYLFNYGQYQFLAIGGYNDKPLTNLFFGFDRTLTYVFLLTALAGLRELIIWLIERPNTRREFRVLIANNITPLFFIYFLILVLTNPIHENFRIYFASVTPVFLLYIYLTFWLFPVKGEIAFAGRFKTQVHIPFIIRLLLSTFIGTLPLIFIFENNDRPFPFLAYWAFLFFIVTPLSWLLYQQRKDKIMQLKGMETALAKSNANLQFLRSQINPHFLFNALNTLYGTALKENSEHTAEGIQKLGDMMRFMLHENNLDFIPMEKEIEYLKNYIALQKLRTQSSSDILIEDNIDEATCNRTIAPMLLIPFIENAFKHGISLKEKSWINIRLDCADKIISFEVRNSIHVRTESDTEKDKSGIGLKNVAERLKLLYPDKHELKVSEDKHEFIVKLIIK